MSKSFKKGDTPLHCVKTRIGEFEFRVSDSDGESVGVYSNEDYADGVVSRRNAWHIQNFLKQKGFGKRVKGG